MEKRWRRRDIEVETVMEIETGTKINMEIQIKRVRDIEIEI